MILCPKCGKCNWRCEFRHPTRPNLDVFKCLECSHKWRRYSADMSISPEPGSDNRDNHREANQS